MQPHFLRLGQHLVNLANGASISWKAGNTLEINFVGGTSPLVFYLWQAEAQALLRCWEYAGSELADGTNEGISRVTL